MSVIHRALGEPRAASAHFRCPDQVSIAAGEGRSADRAALPRADGRRRSRNPDVRVLCRERPIFVDEARRLDQGDDRPVVADAAMVKPPQPSLVGFTEVPGTQIAVNR